MKRILQNHHRTSRLLCSLWGAGVICGFFFLSSVLPVAGQLNRVPMVRNSVVTTPEDTAVPLLFRVTDDDGDTVRILLEGEPLYGTLGRDSNGEHIYIPPPDWAGFDVVTFRAYDGREFSAKAHVGIQVKPVNDPPVAEDSLVTTSRNRSIEVRPLAWDKEGDDFQLAIIDNPKHGSLVALAEGRFLYRPSPRFSGTDSFVYQAEQGGLQSRPATVTVHVQHSLPDPVGIAGLTLVNEDEVAEIEPQVVSDQPVDYRVVITGPPGHGELYRLGELNTFVYSPDDDYYGSDWFTFSVEADGLHSRPVTHRIFVNGVDDPPRAEDILVTTFEDLSPVSILLPVHDPDGGPDLIYPMNETRIGRVVTLHEGPRWMMELFPEKDFSGVGSINFMQTAASPSELLFHRVTVRILPVNDRPRGQDRNLQTIQDTPLEIRLLSSDQERDPIVYTITRAPQHGTLVQIEGQDFMYTPSPGFIGSDEFEFLPDDNRGGPGQPVPGVVRIQVKRFNQPPVVHDQSIEVLKDTRTPLTLAGTDPQGDILNFRILNQPLHGDLEPDENRPDLFYYTPDSDFTGEDRIVFTAGDGELDAVRFARITLNVTSRNVPPVALERTLQVRSDKATEIQISGMDANGDQLHYEITMPPVFGTLSQITPGTYLYTPGPDMAFTDYLQFVVNDGQLTSVPAIITLQLDDAPVSSQRVKSIPVKVAELTEDSIRLKVVEGFSEGWGELVVGPDPATLATESRPVYYFEAPVEAGTIIEMPMPHPGIPSSMPHVFMSLEQRISSP